MQCSYSVKGGELYFNPNEIACVEVRGQDGVSVVLRNGTCLALNDTMHDDKTLVPSFLREFAINEQFVGLGKGYHDGPAEYVNLSLVYRVVFAKGEATIFFANTQKSYRGNDCELIKVRLLRLER